jgi:hypothetical protein
MKLFTGWVVSAGLIFAATGAQAQLRAPQEIAIGTPVYTAISDVGGPYAAMPPEAPVVRYGYGPRLLPPLEVYTVVRESGFSPLGIPHQRGFVYTIAVVDRSGNDGRLVIDARNGRVVRFMPGNWMGNDFNEDVTVNYGAPGYGAPGPAALPAVVRAAPQPPRPAPHIASRTVPVPKASPLTAKPAPQPAQQSAAVAKPAQAATVPQAAVPPAAAPTVGEARPAAPPLQPTQEMPKVQGLE